MGNDLVRFEGAERVDLIDATHFVDTSQQSQHRQWGAEFSTDPAKTPRGFILDGFAITNPTGNQIQVTLGRAIFGQREGGQVYQGQLVSEGEASRIVDVTTFPLSSTLGIFARFEYVDGDSQGRAFWNPQSGGSEYTQTIPTRRLANWSMRIELATPGAEWTQIGEVTTDGAGALDTFTDQRNLFFEGEVHNTYQSGWSSDGGGVANDRSSDRQQYGAKDLQTFTAAVRQCLEDIKGRGLRRWWEQGVGGLNIGFDTDPVEDRLAVGDGDFALDLTVANPRVYFHDLDDSSSERSYIEFIRANLLWRFITEDVTLFDLVNGGSVASPRPEVRFGTGAVDSISYDVNNDHFEFRIADTERVRVDDTGLIIPASHGIAVGHVGPAPAGNISVGNVNFALDYNSGNPRLVVDASDYLGFTRTGSLFEFAVGGVGLGPIGDDATPVRMVYGDGPATQLVNPAPEAFDKTYTITGNSLRVGECLLVQAWGLIGSSGTASDVDIELRIGGTVIGTMVLGSAPGADDRFYLEATIAFTTIGASGQITYAVRGAIGDIDPTPKTVDLTDTSGPGGTFDTTGSLLLDIRVNYTGGNASDVADLDWLMAQRAR